MIGVARALFFRQFAPPAPPVPFPVSIGATVALLSTTITGKSDGDVFTTWAGMSGTTNDGIASSTGPTYKTGGPNGQPFVRFSPTDTTDTSKRLQIASVFAAEPYTILIVRNYPGPIENRVLSGNSANWLLGGWEGNDHSFFAGGSGTLLSLGGSGSATFEIHTVVAASGSAQYWVNSTSLGTTTTSATPGGLTIGSGGLAINESTNTDVVAVIGFPSALSSSDRYSVESWLAGLFGVTIALPPKLLWLESTVGTLKSGSVFTQTNGDALVTWQDQSSNGFNFTASNGPTILTGQQNGLTAIHFTRSSSQKFQRTDAGASSPLNLTGDFTISFVIKLDSWADGNSTGVIGKKITDGVDGWQIYNDGGQPSFINMRINGSNNFFDTTNVSTSVAQLFTFQRSGATGRWYVNGTLRGSGSVPTGNSATAAPINIGFSETWSGYLNGKLYEIQVYDAAFDLTALHASLMTKYAL